MVLRAMRPKVAWMCVAAFVVLSVLLGCQGKDEVEPMEDKNLTQDVIDQKDTGNPPEGGQGQQGEAYEEGVVLVVFERDATVEKAKDSLASLGATCPDGFEQADVDSGACVVVALPKGMQVPEAVEALQALDVVEIAQPNYYYRLF